MAIASWRIQLVNDVKAIQRFDDTATYDEIAERLHEGYTDHTDLNKNVISAAFRDYKNHQETTVQSPPLLKRWNGSQYEYVSIELPRYDIKPVIQRDTMAIGDIHLPSTNYALAYLMVDIARHNMAHPHFTIMGDMLNLDSMSSFERIVPTERLSNEIGMTKGFLEYLMNVGDVAVFGGNHEIRWSRKLDGVLDLYGLWQLVEHGMKTGSIQFHAETSAWVHSGKQKWLLTHQRNYSKIKGRVANTISLQRQSNVVCFHQHHFGGIVSDNGLYAAFDNGGLHDDALIHYCNLYDSTSPRMTNGFNMIRDGVGHQFTPYEQITDYSLYGVDASAVFAYERKKQAIYLGNYKHDNDGVIQIQGRVAA